MNGEKRQDLPGLLEKATTFALANLFWVLLCIPVVTIPAATAGLFATLTPWARGKSSEVFSDFFGGMRQYWRKASLVGVVDALIGILVVVNFLAFRVMDMSNPIAVLSRSITLFIALIAIMVNLYLWPMMVSFDMPLRQLVANAVRLVFVHPLWSLFMVIVAVLPLVASLVLPAALVIFATISTMALLVSKAAWRIIRRYVPEEEVSAE
jgi:uncharacterized membrane protein YesL